VVGALHYLVLEGRASWDDVGAALRGEARFVRHYVLEQGIQTNEVQRSWLFLPAFLELARRAGADTLDLIELGPSAGLNLAWDRFRYVYANGAWGGDDAPLELRGEERAPVPRAVLEARPVVQSRVGVDLAPIDVTTDEGARTLKSFVWADQTWRLELLDRAIEAVRADPPRLVRGDLVEELPGLLAGRRLDGLTLVWQSSVLGYVSDDGVRRVRDELAREGRARGSLAYVYTGRPWEGEHTFYGLWAQLWPGDGPERLATGDFHGAWLDWGR
jgi:hypothetical protein